MQSIEIISTSPYYSDSFQFPPGILLPTSRLFFLLLLSQSMEYHYWYPYAHGIGSAPGGWAIYQAPQHERKLVFPSPAAITGQTLISQGRVYPIQTGVMTGFILCRSFNFFKI